MLEEIKPPDYVLSSGYKYFRHVKAEDGSDVWEGSVLPAEAGWRRIEQIEYIKEKELKGYIWSVTDAMFSENPELYRDAEVIRKYLRKAYIDGALRRGPVTILPPK